MEEFIGLPKGFKFDEEAIQEGLDENQAEILKVKSAKPLYSLIEVEFCVIASDSAKLRQIKEEVDRFLEEKELEKEAGEGTLRTVALQRTVLDLAIAVTEGRYLSVIGAQLFSSVVGDHEEDEALDEKAMELRRFKIANRVEKYLQDGVIEFIENGDAKTFESGDPAFRESIIQQAERHVSQKVLRSAAVMFLAISLFSLFLQANSTGPPVNAESQSPTSTAEGSEQPQSKTRSLKDVYPLPFLRGIYDRKAGKQPAENVVKEELERLKAEAEALSAITGKNVEPVALDEHPGLHKYTRKKLSIVGSGSGGRAKGMGEKVYQHMKFLHFLHMTRLLLRILARSTLKANTVDPVEFLPEIVSEKNFNQALNTLLTTSSDDQKVEERKASELVAEKRGSVPPIKVPQMFRLAVTKLVSLYWWTARSAVSHFNVLEIVYPEQGTAPLLKLEVEELFGNTVRVLEALKTSDLSSQLDEAGVVLSRCIARVYLERGIGHHYFHEVEKAKSDFDQARKLCQLEVTLSGALGKRTKFQLDSKAQLVLSTKSLSLKKASGSKIENVMERVQLEELDAETPLLEKIQYDEESKVTENKLDSLEECLVLALCMDVKNSYAMEWLTSEQMSAYVEKVLHFNSVSDTKQDKEPGSRKTLFDSNWLIYSTALLIKSNLEFQKYKTKERSVLQLQLLVDQQDTKLTYLQNRQEFIEKSAPIEQRLQWFHSLTFPYLWRLKLNLANKYLKLGVAGSALEICMQCRLFEAAIECLVSMGKKSRAVKLINTLLETEEGGKGERKSLASEHGSPNLYCQLGILNNDLEMFEKAWQVSEFKYPRAKRLLGLAEFEKGNLEQCIVHYNQALGLNPFFPDAWFKLGVACMKTNRLQEAKVAFLQVINQVPSDADSYGNLSVILERLSQKEVALNLVEQAVRYNRNSWKLWENFLRLALELKDWNRVLIALNRLIDLKLGLGGRVKVEQKADIDTTALILLIDGIITENKVLLHQPEASQQREKRERGNGLTGVGKIESKKRQLKYLKTQVCRLFNRIKAECKSDANVWKVFSVFFSEFTTGEESGEVAVFKENFKDCLLRRVRALKNGHFAWEKEESSAKKVVRAVEDVVKAFLSEGDTGTDRKEEKAEAQREWEEVRLMIDSTTTTLLTQKKQLTGDGENKSAEEVASLDYDFKSLLDRLSIVSTKLNDTQPR